MVDGLDRACTRWGMAINGIKTKVLKVGEQTDNHQTITLKGNILEEVDSFSYLGSKVGQTARVDRDVGSQTGEGSYSIPDVEEEGL